MIKSNNLNVSQDGREFRDSIISGNIADMTNCRFYNCDFIDASTDSANFSNSVFHDCTFKNTNLQNTNMTKTGIYNCHFYKTNLENACLQETSIRHSTFNDNTTLSNIDLAAARFDSVYFRNVIVDVVPRNLDSLYITMGGATHSEVENHRRAIMAALNRGEGTTTNIKTSIADRIAEAKLKADERNVAAPAASKKQKEFEI